MRANEVKREMRFFTIADYKEEEIYLREQHKKGFRFTRFALPCFYYFEKCEPEDIIYQLDFSDGKSQEQEYKQIYRDTGWEYLFDVNGWSYFRKPAATSGEEEIYSDKESKVMHLDKIVKRRMLPLLVIFLCCVIPNFLRYALDSGNLLFKYGWGEAVLTIFWYVMFFAYVWMVSHCVRKLHRMKKEMYDGKI